MNSIYCCNDFEKYFGKLSNEDFRNEGIKFCPFCGRQVEAKEKMV